MITPFVSVLMITYNHENFIRGAIEGILIQKTTFPIELIIGEDCSTDNTRKIVVEYAEKYPKIIRPLLPEKNVGMMKNFIETMQVAKGKYIALCEGDDYWTDPYKLQIQVDFLEKKELCAMVFTSSKKYYEKENCFKNWHVELTEKSYFAKEIINNLLIPTCTAVFRNSNNLIQILEKRLTNENYIFGDMILWLSLLDFGTIECLPIETAVYRRNNESVSGVMSLDLQIKLLKQHEQIAIDFDGKYQKFEKMFLSRQYLVVSLKLLRKFELRFINYFLMSIRKSISLLPSNVIYVTTRFVKNDY